MKRIYTGIDFGSNYIKIVVAEAIGKSFHVLAHNIVRAKGIKKGLIVDIEEVVGCLKSGIKEIEDSLSVRIDQAIVNVSSNGIIFDVVDGNIDIKNEEDRNKLSYEAAFYNMTLEYQSMKKFLYIPEEYITEGGFPIGRVWAELRDDYDQNRLGGQRISDFC